MLVTSQLPRDHRDDLEPAVLWWSRVAPGGRRQCPQERRGSLSRIKEKLRRHSTALGMYHCRNYATSVNNCDFFLETSDGSSQQASDRYVLPWLLRFALSIGMFQLYERTGDATSLAQCRQIGRSAVRDRRKAAALSKHSTRRGSAHDGMGDADGTHENQDRRTVKAILVERGRQVTLGSLRSDDIKKRIFELEAFSQGHFWPISN